MIKKTFFLCVIVFFFYFINSCKTNRSNNNWILCSDTNNKYGYLNLKGDTVIACGKYEMCITDTFKNYAIVYKNKQGWVAINKNEQVLYQVFPFDNGPDVVENGLFRIIDNNKIGYAEAQNGNIIIKPQFSCAYPFYENFAKVSNNCEIEKVNEYTTWKSEQWFKIDKTGKTILE